jgi:hypothetical protein
MSCGGVTERKRRAPSSKNFAAATGSLVFPEEALVSATSRAAPVQNGVLAALAAAVPGLTVARAELDAGVDLDVAAPAD